VLKRLLPYLDLFASVMLLVISLIEIIDSFDEAVVGLHHGIFLYMVVHIIKTIPDIKEGIEGIKRPSKD
jgi:hypothetical protein